MLARWASRIALARRFSTRHRMPRAQSLDAGFTKISEPWSPAVGGDINDMQIKLVKLEGEFVWHDHTDEDELFLVHKGAMRMHMRNPVDATETHVDVHEGEFIVIPRLLEHKPACLGDTPTEVVLLEPSTTLNTGSAAESSEAVERGLTKETLDTI